MLNFFKIKQFTFAITSIYGHWNFNDNAGKKFLNRKNGF